MPLGKPQFNSVFDKAYAEWLASVARRYRSSQIKAALAVNSEMILFYWSLGADICRMEGKQPWGSKFMQRLGADLRREMPGAGCFSRINLYYMCWFHKLYCSPSDVPQVGEHSHMDDGAASEAAFVPQVGEQMDVAAFRHTFPNVANLLLSVPWGHHKILIDKFRNDRDTALFYVRRTMENGWSRSVLSHWIGTNLHLREGRADTNFDRVPAIAGDSDLSRDLLKDPYDFSFLEMDERYREAELKKALVANIEHYLLELGEGFCFKGREVNLRMGDEVRALDMLFYNDEHRFYLVVEVKVRKFDPMDVGQINAYMSAVNHQFRKSDDGPTVGLIICREKDRVTARYALEDVNKPIGVAEYALEKFMPESFRSELPTIEEIEADQTRRLQLTFDSAATSSSAKPNP